MKVLWMAALTAISFSACKKEDKMVTMTNDMCACISIMMNASITVDSTLRANNFAQTAELDAYLNAQEKQSTDCFQGLEKKYGNMEAYQLQIMEQMKTSCPLVLDHITKGQR
jgi:hypothetical protein